MPKDRKALTKAKILAPENGKTKLLQIYANSLLSWKRMSHYSHFWLIGHRKFKFLKIRTIQIHRAMRFINFSTARKIGSISYIRKAFFVRNSPEYETSDSDQKVIQNLYSQMRICSLFCPQVSTSIRKKSNTVREQPPRLCKNNNSKINCESAIGQHLLTSAECSKTYTDDNFRINRQARSSFHLSVLESVYIETQNPVLCKQKDFIFCLESSSK